MVVAQEHPPAVPPAAWPSVGGTVPRDGGDATGAGGAALHRGRAHGAGHPLLAAGRAAGPAALGQPGSGPAPHQGPGAAGHASRDPGAGAAGARPADRPGAGVDGHQGPCRPGGGADLRPGAGVVRTGWRDPPALPDAVGLMSVLSQPGGVADGAGARGTARPAGAAGGRPDAPPGGA